MSVVYAVIVAWTRKFVWYAVMLVKDWLRYDFELEGYVRWLSVFLKWSGIIITESTRFYSVELVSALFLLIVACLWNTWSKFDIRFFFEFYVHFNF